MAFGMMAIVGLQTTLRQNSDIAKQRSEAVRIAEEAIEQWRAFSAIETTTGRKAYDDLAGPLDDIVFDADNPARITNTTFTLQQTVAAFAPGLKSIQAAVSWTDRTGKLQSVTLNSIIAKADPALSGMLTMEPGGAPSMVPPLGRNPAIPVEARDMQDGKSAFMPAGAGGGVLWVFDNLIGVIVGVCNTVVTGQAALTQADTQACVDSTIGPAVQLSGVVRFSTGFIQPTAANSENPTSTALNLAVTLTLSSTGHPTPNHNCFVKDPPLSASTTDIAVRYYCAILFNANAPLVWSGISELAPLPFLLNLPPDYVPWALADDADDVRATRYRICRYTPATSDTQAIPNQLHPRTYTHVTAVEQLKNQNFLVIRAGNDTDTFQCPPDVLADPATGDFVNSNTLLHQPPPSTP